MNLDEVVSRLVERLAPLKVPLGPAVMELTAAEFTGSNDNTNVEFLNQRNMSDFVLSGMASMDCGFLGTHDGGVKVTVDASF